MFNVSVSERRTLVIGQSMDLLYARKISGRTGLSDNRRRHAPQTAEGIYDKSSALRVTSRKAPLPLLVVLTLLEYNAGSK
jgi:hypothetical protein